MDEICTVSTKELYLEVQTLNVPFHKVRCRQWYEWLEQKLK
jgi:hypothetical protein